eukprot:TRINITY_DN113717_c0_g1_i1.p1 TRINITY_DN113717_c0_g1~~TRINITY_DN113717_c0_g1_i1.p1  ORF type:complete len:156 (+),score=24.63 TRINITY_DN113717_c0_g1_i1:3-470(+)
MVSADPRHGRWMTLSCLFRGKMTTCDIEAEVLNRVQRWTVEWIPHNAKYTLCSVPPRGLTQSATLVGTNTAILEAFTRVGAQFSEMFNRKAFLHWYIGEGMEEMEFLEAEANLADLVHEYQQYQDAYVDETDYWPYAQGDPNQRDDAEAADQRVA